MTTEIRTVPHLFERNWANIAFDAAQAIQIVKKAVDFTEGSLIDSRRQDSQMLGKFRRPSAWSHQHLSKFLEYDMMLTHMKMEMIIVHNFVLLWLCSAFQNYIWSCMPDMELEHLVHRLIYQHLDRISWLQVMHKNSTEGLHESFKWRFFFYTVYRISISLYFPSSSIRSMALYW